MIERGEISDIVIYLFKYLGIKSKEDIEITAMLGALGKTYMNFKCPDFIREIWNVICNAIIENRSVIIQRPGHKDIDLDDIVNIVLDLKISLVDLRCFLSQITKGTSK